MVKSLPWTYRPYVEGPRARTPRLVAAALLRFASAVLTRMARQLAAAEKRRQDAVVRATVLEFYAEAGAPEGALYADGQLVGYLSGVKRL
jgi:hypothetical protein